MKQGGFAPIIIVLIAAIIIAGGAAGYFFVFKQGPTDAIPPPSGSLPPAGIEERGTSGTSAEPTPQTSPAPPAKKASVSTDPKLLEGLWRIETAYEWVNPPGVWKENGELLARVPYQEFKNGTMCRSFVLRIFEQLTAPPTLEQALDKMYCSEYKPYRILDKSEYKPKDTESSALTFTGEQYGTQYTWKIVGGKLELEQPGGRGIYVKIPGTRDIATEPKDTEKPKITLFKASSQLVKAGGEITFTCSATDNSGSVQIDFDIVGIIAGGTANAFEGGPFRSNGDSFTLTHKPPVAGSYTATCQVSDEAHNRAESTLHFSAD